MLQNTRRLLERLDGYLDEARQHPGVAHYLKTHEVVYHGQAGRFHVYSAEKSANPAGQVTDLSKLPRFVRTRSQSTEFPNGPTDIPAGPDGKPHPLVKRQAGGHVLGGAHVHGHEALRGARVADAHLTRLGMPSHRLTVIATPDPISIEPHDAFDPKASAINPVHPAPATYRGVTAHYIPQLHHAALNVHADDATSPGIIAHEWAHHHQKNMTNAEQGRLKSEFKSVKRDGTAGAFASDYGRTNWAEWHATGIEGETSRPNLYPANKPADTGTPLVPGAKVYKRTRVDPTHLKTMMGM